jgi:phosphate-selective porin OprO and OprP
MMLVSRLAPFVLVLSASAAFAQSQPQATTQTSSTAGQQPAAPAPPRVAAGPDGFAIESGNGDYRLQIGVLLHADARFDLTDSSGQVPDTFYLRRLRPYFKGRFARRFEFYVVPDFALGTVVVQDMYIDSVFARAFRLRAGKGKTPFGMERLHSASNLLFMERALPTAVVPNRDIGIQALGDLHGGMFSYLGGVMNGVADGGSSDLDTNDGKDFSGRFIVRPFNRQPAHPLKGLYVAMSGSAGQHIGVPLATFRTQTIQQPYFSYATGAANDGARIRYSPQVSYYYKRFGGFSEYVHSEAPVRRGAVRDDIAHQAWQMAGSWVLTGEAATDAGVGVRPKSNFDFGNGHWGALQIAARYHTLKIDDEAFTRGFAAAGASRKAESWTVGLNWYLTPNFRYTFNFERTVFDDNAPGARPTENGLAFRTGINF